LHQSELSFGTNGARIVGHGRLTGRLSDLPSGSGFRPGQRIVVVGDADGRTEDQTKAACEELAGRCAGVRLAYPLGDMKDPNDILVTDPENAAELFSEFITLAQPVVGLNQPNWARRRLVTMAEMMASLGPPNWLIEKYLERDTLALMFGQPKSGKTFAALDMALCVAAGIPYDLISAVFMPINVPITLELFPMKRVLRLLKRGERDGATVISRNAEREKYITFSEPVFQKRGLIYFNKRKHPNFSWNSYSDLKGLLIGTVLGHNYGDEFLSNAKKMGLLIKQYRREHKIFELLNAGRLDIVLSIELVGRKVIAQQEYGDTIEAAEKPYLLKNYHIGLSQHSSLRHRLGEINQAIIKLKGDGTLDDIVNRHLEKKK
jgi:ABC-type amino acid transport substrate-binding protein